MHGLDHGSGPEILRGCALVERVFQLTEFGLAPLAGAHLAHDDDTVVPLRDLVRSDDHLSIAVVDGERRRLTKSSAGPGPDQALDDGVRERAIVGDIGTVVRGAGLPDRIERVLGGLQVG